MYHHQIFRIDEIGSNILQHPALTQRFTHQAYFTVGQISQTVGREVDLIDLQAVTGTVRHQAMTKGIVLVNKDPNLYAKIMRDMLYYEADLAPQIQQLIDYRLKKFIDG